MAGRRIDTSLREWLDARLTERGLKDLMDGELSWRVLDYRSENFIQEVDRVMSNQRAKGRGLFGRFRR